MKFFSFGFCVGDRSSWVNSVVGDLQECKRVEFRVNRDDDLRDSSSTN